MAAKRGQGVGSLYWSEERQRWAAMASLGYDAAGKRVRKVAYGRTKTEARSKLRELIRDIEDGLAVGSDRYTVGGCRPGVARPRADEGGRARDGRTATSPRRTSCRSSERSCSASLVPPRSIAGWPAVPRY